MKRTKAFILVIGIIIAVLSVVEISVANVLTTEGVTLDTIQNKIAQYQKENTQLSEKVYATSSLYQIASDAATLGFVQQKSQIYMTGSLPVAMRQ